MQSVPALRRALRQRDKSLQEVPQTFRGASRRFEPKLTRAGHGLADAHREMLDAALWGGGAGEGGERAGRLLLVRDSENVGAVVDVCEEDVVDRGEPIDHLALEGVGAEPRLARCDLLDVHLRAGRLAASDMLMG